MSLMRFSFSAASVAAFVSLAGCSTQVEGNENPVDVTVEGTDETNPNYTVNSFSCSDAQGYAIMSGEYGETQKFYPEPPTSYGQPPTQGECTAWCNGCGKPTGQLALFRRNSSWWPDLWYCICYPL